MWLSKITYDLAAARANHLEFTNIVRTAIVANRIELQAKYGGGEIDYFVSLGGEVVGPDWTKILLSDITTVIGIRSWPTESTAQEHVDFVVLQAAYITGTVEEQV